MSLPSTPRPLPLWLKTGGSLFAIWHVVAVGMLALAANSGPWPAPPPIGADQQVGPLFARAIAGDFMFPVYCKPLRMTNNYHFVSNLTDFNAVHVEIELKDESGHVVKKVKLPDDKANFWVRHRQGVLVFGLAQDQPVQVPATERIAPAGQKARRVEFLDMTEPGVLRLVQKPGNEVPTDRPVHRPSDTGKALAESYMRYLCREHKAASAELIRVHRPPVMPGLWFIDGEPAPDTFIEIKTYYGEYRREQ